VTRVERPFSRLLPARSFPTMLEVWDVAAGRRLHAQRIAASGGVRRTAWKPGADATLGWVEEPEEGERGAIHRWMAIEVPFSGPSREIAASKRPITAFGWTTAGTPLFVTRSDEGKRVHLFRVGKDGPEELWSGSTEDRYGNPGRAIRRDGRQGPVLESEGRIFLASDGLGPEGPAPYLEAVDLATHKGKILFESEPGVYEAVVGVLDPATPWLVTSRETERDPPNLYALRGGERAPIRPFADPFPDLANVERRSVAFPRADGVMLGGTLYRPPNTKGPLPTLVWIYPREFTDPGYAEQVDVKRYRFHEVKGPSPLAVLLSGYALLLNPTMPIIGEADRANDAYLEQLAANAQAAVRFLVSSGTADPERIAIAGRSYGAFSTANLLAHTALFRTGIAVSGAYNRTLTPFGFQHEKRSFWKVSDLYARISPFFYADQIEEPLLLIHGGADPNPGTPPLQARRFFHALVGNGADVRYVEMPYEGHQYWARESVLHVASEMLDWLGRTIGDGAPPHPRPPTSTAPASP
jgi:dipeptidyl aminopeptidase/acylaminoacyl peptidase